MNLILLIFVILAATFIASSANNLITVSSAVEQFLSKADSPDHWIGMTREEDVKRFEELARENGYDYHISRLVQIDPGNVFIEGKKMEYSNTVTVSSLGRVKIFDKNNEEITEVRDGEIYVPYMLFDSADNDYHEGGRIRIEQDGVEKEFTLMGYTKDVAFGSPMVGMTRLIISKNDLALFDNESAAVVSFLDIYTKDADFKDKFNALGSNVIFSADSSMARMLYFMDTLMAAVLLIVSLCLILISMVILRFIITFTIVEEFREIGVMKAIGIKNYAIRGLYIVKYFAIAAAGTAAGLALSFPFSRVMIGPVTKKIVISGESNFFLNIGAAVSAGAAVVLFCFFCTGKIHKFSPMDAIRSGETGERFRKKGVIHLGKSHLPTVAFMALNDIFSGIRSYLSMIIIFILGTLLVIIPVNTINTLRSDDLILLFNMTKSDHIISKELLFNANEDNRAKVERQFLEIRDMFSENGIAVDVFQEIMFRSNVKKGNKLTNSLTFIGMGGVTTDDYTYLDGTPPQNAHEVALTYLTAEQIDAVIGDDVEIKIGDTTETYTVTGITQSMNNMGEGVRFHQDAEPDFDYAAGSFGIQINYRDNPDAGALSLRKELLEKLYPDAKIFTPGEYIGHMIGDVAGQLDSMKLMILSIILSINALVAVLMVKSFITREKGEIALLKAMGFQNGPLTLWQTLRIGIVLIVSVLTGALLSSPLSNLIITPLFRMMGAYSIEYKIRGIEVYFMYPVIVLAVTAFAAFLSARGLKKIHSTEISNNE